MDIALGSQITIEVTANPKREAARKTLVKLLSKDPAIVKFRQRMQEKRPSHQQWQRGGRMWNHRMKTMPSVKIEKGAKHTIRATYDVVRELQSVNDYVSVTPA